MDRAAGFGSADMRVHQGMSQSPTYPTRPIGGYGELSDEDQEAVNATAAATLTASLHKIQALAHEQTERMKQINYSEKKTDLAEVVYEKSSQWRARGAEWGGIAKKAWDDRGGMNGIAGGLADRWKRRGLLYFLSLINSSHYIRRCATFSEVCVSLCFYYHPTLF